ncbi:MAG: hypothetical protein DHS20C10_02180 [marine bacterium B5-7]|nr:MAG: hypothetical protein DHS20C10_02180 [marine bacterium B5-7]
MNTPWKKASHLAQKACSPLAGLMAQHEDIAFLRPILTKALTDEEKSHVWIMNVRKHVLVLGVANSAWLTKMRYRKVDLLSALRAAYPKLKNIDLKIDLQTPKTNDKPRFAPRPTLQENTLEDIEEKAMALKAPHLKKALFKLITHLRSKRSE